MFEHDAEKIVERVVALTLRDRDAISLNEVLATGIPTGLKTFMQTGLLNELKQELRTSPRFARVSHTIPGILVTERTLLRALSLEYVFPKDEFVAMLRQGVRFLIDYLTCPQASLMQFLFEGHAATSFASIVQKLEFVSDYGYISRLVERVGKERQWTTVKADDFKELIAKIDNQVTGKHQARELAMIARPIFDLFFLGATTRALAIPSGAIVAFYADKQLPRVKEYIEKICHIRSQADITLNELIEIIEDFYLVKRPEAGHPSVASAPGIPSPPPASSLLKRDTEPGAPPKSANIPLVLTYPDPARAEPSGELKDLEQVLTKEQRLKFIEGIFQNDDEYFEVFVTALNMTMSWQEARQFLADLCKLKQLDPTSEQVVEFSNAIRQRYEASPMQ